MNLSVRLAAGGADAAYAQLPGSLKVNPRLARWLRVRPEGTVEVRPGKVEIGQGIVTALAQIAADELDVALTRITMVPASTAASPDEAVTSGSLSVQECGVAIRYACAEVRALFVAAAARRLGAAAESLEVRDGEIVAPGGARTSYWALAGEVDLDRDATANVAPKPAAARRVAGLAAQRLDLPDKVHGIPRFVHDLTLPGMLHGRVLRPPSPGAALVALDDTAVRARPGVTAVVRDGSFVGVLAEHEHAALGALEVLRKAATWREQDALPDEGALADWLKTRAVETRVVDETPAADVAAARTYGARYTRPFLAHASIGPSCAVAQWEDSAAESARRLRVWSHSQGIYNLRADLALVLGLPAERIVVQHGEGAGCYGHNGADDVALDAALLARAANGRPVKVVWSRADELACSPAGPAMAIEIEADLAEDGKILAWRHEVWSNGHTARPGRAATPALLAARDLARPFEPLIASNPPAAGGGGAERNAVPAYDIACRRVLSHRVLEMPVRTSALRSLGAYANVFAIESFMDELARSHGADPLEYRLRHLPDPRARAVLEAAARRSAWGTAAKRENVGRGVAFARYKGKGAYCAVVAEVEAEREIRIRRLTVAADVGEVVNPDGLANQLEGGAIQASSWTLKEALRFDRTHVTSTSWDDYPILKFSDVPPVDVEIVSRPELPPLGAGEAAQGPTAAAIANAVCDALGVRVRDLPLTPERIVAAAGG